jgi:glycosyltransferase involved in cell wall biosynthesis
MEGGANAISEALAASVPILASQISGSIGLLGADYPGYFPVGDTHQLACLLQRAETDPEYYETLRTWCARLAPLVDPARERRSWEALLQKVTPARYCASGAAAPIFMASRPSEQRSKERDVR